MKKLLLVFMLISSIAFAQEGKQIPLYPNGVPNSKPTPATYIEIYKDEHYSKVSNPTITPFFPEKGKANGAAVIICPGGAYAFLAIGHEGYAVAKEFNRIGVTAFVLKYRLPSDSIMVDKTIGPLQDAQRAIQLVRQRAAEFNIDPNRVGIIGFSAGGHLASTVETHFNKAVIENKDNINLRPDFAILGYPVVSFGEYAHAYSKEMLIGKNPSQELVDLYSNEKQVTANTPPTFIVHASDDYGVPVQNSLQFYDALVKAKVKAEMHLYQNGGHGFGLNNKTTKDYWFDRLENWMNENGWLAKK